MIIDFHTHVFPPKMKENRDHYIERDPCFAMLYSRREAELATAEELAMDEAGINVSVIVNIGWTTHELCVETNDYILESVAHYSSRLVGFCAVQPSSCEAAVAEIEHCAKAGIKGVGEVRPDLQLFDLLDDTVMEHLAAALRKYDLVLLTHTSEPSGQGYPSKGGITPEVLYPLFTRFPDLTVVCACWGGGLPFYALMPEVKQALGNVFFDTAASAFRYSTRVYNQVVQLVGAGRILFGSDYPSLSQDRALNDVISADLLAEARSLILSGNAQRLLGIRGD